MARDADAEHRAAGRAWSAAERRAPPLRLALHAARAHRADRAHDARADPRAAAASDADAGADPRPQGLRPGDGLGRVPGRGLPPARRRAGRGLAGARRPMPTIPADEDEVLLRPAAGRAALPLRRGQEPDGGRPGEAVALAGDAGEGPPVHVPRPRAAARRLAGRADAASRSRRSTGSRPSSSSCCRPGSDSTSASSAAARIARRDPAKPATTSRDAEAAEARRWPTRR